MGRGISVVALFTLAANAVNYGSNLIFSRLLEPVGFGELTALLALAVVIVVPTGAAQTVIAERVAVHVSEGRGDTVRYLVRHAIGHVGVIALIVGAIYLACIPLVISALDLRQPGPAIALAPFIVLSFLQPIALGLLQGLDRFSAFGAMQLAIALSRIIFGVPWVLAGGAAGGAIGGQALGVGVVLVCTTWLLRDLILPRGTGAARAGIRRKPSVRTVTASMAFVAFAVLSNTDILLARLFLDPHDAGIYAAIATVGKIIIFLPGALAVVLVPHAARAHRTGESLHYLRTAALVVLCASGAIAIPAALFPHFVVDVMFGSNYSAAAGGVLPIAIAGTGMAMIYLLVVYAVAISDRRWAWVLAIGVLIQVSGVALFHSSPTDVAWVQCVVVLCVLLMNETFFHSLLRHRPIRPSEAP